jgi:hypothetical protein
MCLACLEVAVRCSPIEGLIVLTLLGPMSIYVVYVLPYSVVFFCIRAQHRTALRLRKRVPSRANISGVLSPCDSLSPTSSPKSQHTAHV